MSHLSLIILSPSSLKKFPLFFSLLLVAPRGWGAAGVGDCRSPTHPTNSVSEKQGRIGFIFSTKERDDAVIRPFTVSSSVFPINPVASFFPLPSVHRPPVYSPPLPPFFLLPYFPSICVIPHLNAMGSFVLAREVI